MEWTIAAYGERYGVKDTDLPVSFRFEQHAPLQIESEDLERCLRHLNPWKATPRETAPAVLVKACAHSLSQTTVAQLNHRWKQGEAYVPERWSDADVALLVKAHGRSTSPLDLRPIGVQDSLGKAVMSTTILRAKKAIHSLVSRFPQCAYIKGRSTGTALRQVFSHCRDVREQCSQARLTIRQKFEGQSATECQGGVQASLDRSAAFDLVQWESIKEALDLAGVALEVQDVLMSWLTQVRTEDDELARFFGTVQRGANQQTPSPLEDQTSNKRRRPPVTGFRQGYQQPGNQQYRDPGLVTILAKHVLELEEEIKVLKQDHSLIFFLRPGDHNILHHLFQMAKAFQAKQQSNPTWAPATSSSLSSTIMGCTLKLVHCFIASEPMLAMR
eukprot:s2239_g2.t1